MSDRMVFVVCRDGGYEGFSEPLEAFDTEELANLYVKGAIAGHCSQMKIFALFVNEPKDFEYPASKAKPSQGDEK